MSREGTKLQMPFDDVMQSFGRCCANEYFFEDFYIRFSRSSDKIQELFKNTNMSEQRKLVRHGLMWMILYARGAADSKLKQLGLSHNSRGFGITPDMYELWVNALMRTVRQHDESFTSQLEQSWRKALAPGIEVMLSMEEAVAEEMAGV